MPQLTLNDFLQQSKPTIISWIREITTNAGVTGSGGSVTVEVVPHALSDSSWHSGTLADSQAPQFLLRDGSRSLTGNLAVDTGITIDGVDLSVHVTQPDIHHAQQHVLATNSALGGDHTISGATAGYVLRATGATTAAIAQLQHGDLGGVTANQHHAQVHAIDGADHTITAAAWNVPGATALNTLGLLQARSTTLTTPETLLKSDGAGGIYLRQLGINTNSPARLFHILDNTGAQMRLGYDATNYMDFLVDNGGSWRVAPTGDIIFDPTGNDVRPLTNYDINLGTPLTKYLALYVAELWVDTLVASEVRSTIGGKVNVAPTTELTRDLAGATLVYDTITQRGTTTNNAGAGGGGGSYETITQRGSATSNSTTGTTCSATKPTGVVSGDVLVAVVTWRSGSVTLTPPAGWTQTGSTLNWTIDTFDFFARVYYHVAGGSEPSTYDWLLSASEQIMVSTIAYAGVNNSTPVDAVSAQMNSDSTSSFSAQVTTTIATDRLIYIMACGGTGAGSTTATANGALTERVDGTNALLVKNYMADEALTVAGATGSRSSTLSAAQLNCAYMVALMPATASGNTSVVVNRPTGTTNGDVLIATVAYAGGTLTPPSGWTLVTSQAATGATLAIYRRVASSEPSTYTWGLSTADALAVATSTYYNVNTTTPTPTYGAQANASGTAMTAPTITPGVSSGLLLFAGAVAGNIRATAPAGMGEDADAGTTGIGVYMADQTLASGAATGTRTATLASAAVSAAANVYLLPTGSGGAAPTTIYVKYNNLLNGDRVLLEARGQFEAMATTSDYTIITAGEEYSYTVTRNLDGTGANDWVAGDAVLNTGQTGNGWLELYAQYGLTAAGESSNQRVGPTMVGNVRQSNTWNDFGPRFAAGSLNGLYDYATTVYGFAAGNPNGAWVALDDTNGLRFMSTLATVGYIQPGGNWRFNGDASNYIHWDGSALHVRGDIVVSGAVDWNNVTGSPNLVRNSSFEMDTDANGTADYFNIYNNDGGAVPTTGSIVASDRSQRAQRVSWTGTNLTTKGIWFDITETKAANVDYVLSFWCRTNTATTVGFYENAPAATQTWLTSQATSTTWAYYAVRLRWSSTPAANFYLSIAGGAAIANGWIEFDNVQVTRGSERVPYTASPVDIIGYGGVINMPFQSGAASGLYLTNNYLGYWSSTAGAWRSYIRSNGEAYFGDGTQYMSWNGSTLTISGAINVVGGAFSGVNYAGAASAGGAANSIAGQGALATQSSVTWSTQVTGTGKPADNATVGATWGSNLASIPVRFQDTPSSNGLYVTASALGFYNAGWRSYFDNSGNFFFGYSASNRIEYNASANQLRGIGGGNVQWYASGSNGYLYAGGGAAGVSSRGVEILRSGGSLTRALQFVTAIGTGERAAAIDVYTDTNPILPYYNQNTLWIETFATTGKAFHSIRMVSQTIELAAGVYASSFDAGDVGGNWTAIPFGTGWGNYGGGYQACQYMRFGNIVFLRGLALLSSGTGANIGNLPSGYRPTSGQVMKGCQASSGLARIDITTAGAINVVGGATTSMWVYIDHTFFTA